VVRNNEETGGVLYKRDNGRVWWASWTEKGSTVKRSTRCTSRAAAQLVYERWERDRADPAHAAAAQASLAVEAGLFLDNLRNAKAPEGTMDMYECKVGHIIRLMPDRMIDINVAAVDKYFLDRKEEGAKTSTLYKEWIALRGVLRAAARRGRFTGDLSILKPSWVTSDYKPRKRFLTWEAIGELLDELEIDRACTVAFVIATGARRKEYERATASDVDREAWTVRLHGSKTELSDRAVPIPAQYRSLLVAAEIFLSGRPDGAFPRWPNARRDIASACRRIGRRKAAEAGIDPDAWVTIFPPVTWNDLRRTFSSLLVQRGLSNEVTAKLMGHASTAMVDKVYGRQTTDTLAALVERQIGGGAREKGGRRGVPQASQEGTETIEVEEPEEVKTSVDSEDLGGLSAARTRDLRIKRPNIITKNDNDIVGDEPPGTDTVPRASHLARSVGKTRRPYVPPCIARLSTAQGDHLVAFARSVWGVL
jgi:integrase